MLTLSTNTSAWSWIAELPDPWDQLVTYGPSQFEAHVFVNHLEVDDIRQRRLLERLTPILESATMTPDMCFHALWSGSVTERQRDRIGACDEPNLSLPNRNYFVFEGPLKSAGDWGIVSGLPEVGAELLPGPHLMWPVDRSWFYTCDVDAEMVGLSGSKLLIESVSGLSCT